MEDQAQYESGRATVADDPYDNAFAESFWSRLKAELLEGGTFLSVDDARTEIFDRAA
jgi:transposase InsO family protein